ncbi:TraM recognition domain-containing protein (plasmid) [Trichlorobacter lovleyi]|uniref:type IV secretory system conjugative DNA transfer family protein n=1 Tax=Trichlorobacter lovleyi TaxID=313985 RepID=UPI00223F891F|nr:TraM recognition domain-containing protein [Trichlorobacter lovleyi]QOX80780.1 TraM recognition domain-containing protein [Trichlorobacter lovleyi]
MAVDPYKVTLLGNGQSLDAPTEILDLMIPDSNRTSHMAIFGSTRVGKTRLAENMIEQDIRKGANILFIDPKNDQEVWNKIVQTALTCNREKDLMLVNTAFPEFSTKIDPLSHWFIPEELVAHSIAGIKEGKDPFYRNLSKEVVTVIISALNIIARSEGQDRGRFNFADIKSHVGIEELEKLKESLSSVTTSEELRREALDLCADIERIINTGKENFSKVAASLRVALMELTTGNVGKIVGKASSNRFITRLEEDKSVIMVCQLSSLSVEEAALTLGKVMLSMTKSFVGRVFNSNRRRVKKPLCIYIDEAQSILFPGLEDMFAKAGGANVFITMFVQSVNQIYDAVGKEKGKAILDNTNTKMFMRVPDPETAMYVAAHFGTHKVLSPIMSPSGGITAREVEEDVIKPADVMKLRPREFFLTTYADEKYSGKFKGKTCDSSDTWLEIQYPSAPA